MVKKPLDPMIHVRVVPAVLKMVERWARVRHVSRTAAINTLLVQALEAEEARKRGTSEK